MPVEIEMPATIVAPASYGRRRSFGSSHNLPRPRGGPRLRYEAKESLRIRLSWDQFLSEKLFRKTFLCRTKIPYQNSYSNLTLNVEKRKLLTVCTTPFFCLVTTLFSVVIFAMAQIARGNFQKRT